MTRERREASYSGVRKATFIKSMSEACGVRRKNTIIAGYGGFHKWGIPWDP